MAHLVFKVSYDSNKNLYRIDNFPCKLSKYEAKAKTLTGLAPKRCVFLTFLEKGRGISVISLVRGYCLRDGHINPLFSSATKSLINLVDST